MSREPAASTADVIVSVGAIFVASFVLFALIGTIAGVPEPRVHEEFSYLLAADTFASGRLTNPTHAWWQHFETFHVIHQPTYQSKYQPGQGLALALGKAAWHPILGVWLITASAIAALCWCLSRWLTLNWALAGAFLAAVHPLVLRWTQCYWGGSLALFGGALVIGSIRKVARYDLPVAAIGALILANSRPYEGLVLCLVAAPYFLRHRGKVLAIALLVGGFAAMGYYNERVTGNPLRLPYLVHQSQYGVVPFFSFLRPRPIPEYRHERLREFYAGWAVDEFYERTIAEKLLRMVRGAFRLFIPSMDGERLTQPFPLTYLSLLVLLPVLGALLAAREDRWVLHALTMLLLFTVAMLPLTWLLPHCAAPAAPLLAIILTTGLLRAARWRVAITVFVIVWIASAIVAVWIMRTGQLGTEQWIAAVHRAEIQRELEETGEKHLVIVRYTTRSYLHFEYVANEADIDRAPVVWARELRDNSGLIDHFSDREVWLLDASVVPPRMLRRQ